ncbi:MAG TPA: R3H domain-containing nucleic acid-binding protein [Terriglobales bacterium]|nr:R3H domain-containing nucleic acid-binding protein [Terriglobales bacterium]
MPIPDKVAAAKRIDELLKGLIAQGGFRLKYRILVDPVLKDDRDWERPEILVEFSGSDSELLLERGAELLLALEHLALNMLRLEPDEHDKVSFDCMNYRANRLEELRMAAAVAAEKVRKTGVPFQFSPMSARERRIVHLALRKESDLKTESQGEAGRRYVVVSLNKPAPTKKMT